MLFDTFTFAVFLIIVFAAYWSLPHEPTRARNVLLLFASYVFYGWWDWRFLSLIALSSAVDYAVAIGIERHEQRAQRALLGVSLCVNLGLLGVFKYYDFFIASFAVVLQQLGMRPNLTTLSLVLPVGISFYTFQTLSYTLDVYRGRMRACHDPVAFFSYVSFFPQLVAGPIERAHHLLPQFSEPKTFDQKAAMDGLSQALYGLFKKVVIADTCAHFVDLIFADYASQPPSVLVLGAVYFAFQIYGDFSGYSDIAIGIAKLFGFDLMRNFSYPYFSRDIAEFWRRWHISLSTWFRDYLYIPLGGSRGSMSLKIRNTMIVFLVSGLWHGANWTFVVWGLLNALYFLPLLVRAQNRRHLDGVAEGRWRASFGEATSIALTFALTCLAWVFFRSPTITDAMLYLDRVFSLQVFAMPDRYRAALPLVVLFVVFEWLQRHERNPLALERLPKTARIGLRYVALFAIFYARSKHEQTQFIYFQF